MPAEPVQYYLPFPSYIAMALSWVSVGTMANQDNPLILTAAIVSSIPGLGVISYFCSAIAIKIKCCEEHSLIKCGIFTIEAFVGLLQIAGAALFIYAVLTSSALSELPNPLALEIPAGVFGTIGGCAYIISEGCFCASEVSCSMAC